VDITQLLGFLVGVLETQHLPYAIVGSQASMTYGEARFTNDIDVVVGLTPATLRQFCDAFPDPDFYVSEDGARTAALRGGQFNIIHPESGLQIDVIVPKDQFERGQLDRAIRRPTAADRDALYGAPEDIILKKMEAYQEGGSEKHLRDVASMLKVMRERIDRSYIEQEASTRGYSDVWQAILRRLGY
jgi:hypothetical protein